MRGRILRILGWVFGAALPLLGLGVLVHGVAAYTADRALAAQFSAKDSGVQTPNATVAEVDSGRGDTGLWVTGFPKMVFDGGNGSIRALEPGEQVQVLVWRGGVEGVVVGGTTVYSNGSAPLRPVGDVALACCGLFLACLTGFPGVHIALRALGAGERRRAAVDWSVITAGGAGGLFAIGAYTSRSLVGGSYTVTGVAVLVVLGFAGYAVKTSWDARRLAAGR